MRISDWSSDVCSSDLQRRAIAPPSALRAATSPWLRHREDRILAKRRLTRAVDVEFLARAIGIRVRDEPQHRSGNIGGIGDRKCVWEGKSVSVRVGLGGRRIIKKKNKTYKL